MDPELQRTIEKIHESRPKGSFPPDWEDLNYIDQLMVETQPETALEFGSGLSTAVIWWHMAKRGSGAFYALEADPMWLVINRQTVCSHFPDMVGAEKHPKKPLRGGIVFSGVKTIMPPYMRFGFCPLKHADFVYVDGPACMEDYNVVVNVNELSPHPRVILVDGRERQTENLMAALCADYTAEIDRDHFRTTFRLREMAFA